MIPAIEEDFELELRSLPGVLNVGIGHGGNGEVEAITLLVRSKHPEAVREGALQVASLYYPDATVIVEFANSVTSGRKAGGERVALVRVDLNEADGVSEVHLSYAGEVGIGRAGSGPLIGGAEATMAALRDLGFVIPFYVMTVTKVDTVIGWSVIVTFRSLAQDEDKIGIARSEGDLESSAKATLDALNRYVTAGDDLNREAPDLEALT
jgi:hypothetical protein